MYIFCMFWMNVCMYVYIETQMHAHTCTSVCHTRAEHILPLSLLIFSPQTWDPYSNHVIHVSGYFMEGFIFLYLYDLILCLWYHIALIKNNLFYLWSFWFIKLSHASVKVTVSVLDHYRKYLSLLKSFVIFPCLHVMVNSFSLKKIASILSFNIYMGNSSWISFFVFYAHDTWEWIYFF